MHRSDTHKIQNMDHPCDKKVKGCGWMIFALMTFYFLKINF